MTAPPQGSRGKVIVIDDDGQSLEVDRLSRSLVTIRTAHRVIHTGESFCLHNLLSGDNNEVLSMLIETSNKNPHMTICAFVNNQTDFYLYEKPTISDRGTPLNVINRNRQSGSIARTSVFLSPTVVSNGDALAFHQISADREMGNLEHSREEIVLKTGEQYLLRFITRAASTGISYGIDWYETSP